MTWKSGRAARHRSWQTVTIGQTLGEVPRVEVVALGDVTAQTVGWVAQVLTQTVVGFEEYGQRVDGGFGKDSHHWMA